MSSNTCRIGMFRNPKGKNGYMNTKYLITISFLLAISKDGHIRDLRIRLGIILKETNEFIGWCCSGIKDELTPPSREIMFAISKEYRNKGYATQAVQGLVSYLFENADVNDFAAIALVENIPSNRVIVKSGIQFHSTIDIDNESYHYYKVLRSNLV